MSKLYVNEIYPQSGDWVAVSGNLDVSGTLTAFEYNTIVQSETTYLGSNSFGNDSADVHAFTGSIEITGSGVTFTGAEAGAVTLTLKADQGDDSESVTLTAADGGAFTIDSTTATVTVDGHTGVTITSSNSGEVDITSAANVDINATTGVTIDAVGVAIGAGSGELDLTTTGILDINSAALDIDTSGAITIDAAGVASHIALVTAHTSGLAFHIDANADAASEVQIDAGVLDIDVTAAATIDAVGIALGAGSGELDLTTTGTLDVNANALDMDLTDSSTITITSSEAAEDLTIAQVGAYDSSILITAAGTGTDAIGLSATAGGITIDAETDIILDANGADIQLKDNGTMFAAFNHSATGVCDIQNGAGDAVVLMDDGDRKLYFFDKGGEYIVGDGTDLEIVSGAELILDAASVTLEASTDIGFVTDTATFSSANANDPLVIIQNTTDDALGARLRFVSNDTSAGADDDVLGNIEFYGDDDGGNQTAYAKIYGEVLDASNGTEGGALVLQAASHNGTLTTGLEIMDGDASGEIDVEIGAGTASVTTVAGNLTVTTDLTVSGNDITFGNGATIVNTNSNLLTITEAEILLPTTSKLSFHDVGGENIVASADGHLEINAGTTLDVTAPTIELYASSEVFAQTPELVVENTTASSATQGGKLYLMCDDGAAMGEDHRLGVIEFAGAEDGSNNDVVGARIEAICDDDWSPTVNDTRLVFYTTDANASESEVLRLNSDKIATFSGELKVNSYTANAAGAGVGNAASQTMHVAKVNGEIVTTILIDIQGLVNDGTASDVIGDSGESAAYITQITSAVNGVIYKAEMACIEEPTTCTADIDLVGTRTSLAEGATASSATDYISIIAPGAAYEPGTCRYTASGADLIDITESESYIYLVHGGSGASVAGTYGAGKFIIKFYGASF